MVELSTIARPYAEAAYQVAKASNNLQQWSDWMESWAAVANSSGIKLLVGNPKLSKKQVLDVFIEVSQTSNQPEAKNFLEAIIENSRLLALPEIATQFTALKLAGEGASKALITSAFPMDEAELANIAQSLETKFGRKLEMAVEVDESLIGGICVTVGDQVLDSSVRSQLNTMKSALTA